MHLFSTRVYNTNRRIRTKRVSDVMVSVLASSAVDRGFEPRSAQTKDYKIGICYFFAIGTQQYGERAKTGWLQIRIICPSGRDVYLRTVVSVS